jgi:crotonobetainyl-CoA:carnitine CoA-transferase CaiB-like acyl-CoA transferase
MSHGDQAPTRILNGIRVVEVATWTFVPAAGGILADWGADVIKIEPPNRPDPQRTMVTGGMRERGDRNSLLEQANRGKRSIGLDLSRPKGLEVLHRLVASSDVFATNLLPAARAKLRVDVVDLRRVNPALIYARGSGFGVHGPDAEKAGYDGTAYVARGSFADGLTGPDAQWPVAGATAVGDLPAAMNLAGGILGALFHRERTGEATTVDISLLATAMWTMAANISAVGITKVDEIPRRRREEIANPLSIYYRSKDGRFVKLSMFESDRYFADLCVHLDVNELAHDERFIDAGARARNRAACVGALDEAFARFTLGELTERFATLKGAWGLVQTPRELFDDPQVRANGYLVDVMDPAGGPSFQLVGPPVQFAEAPAHGLRPAPGHGEQTDEVLAELGIGTEELLELKVDGAVL